jgi:hypothetical protein
MITYPSPLSRKAMGKMMGRALGTKIRLAMWATPPSTSMATIRGTTSFGILAVVPRIMRV